MKHVVKIGVIGVKSKLKVRELGEPLGRNAYLEHLNLPVGIAPIFGNCTGAVLLDAAAYSLPVLLLDVASNVHEEGDRKQQGLHDV